MPTGNHRSRPMQRSDYWTREEAEAEQRSLAQKRRTREEQELRMWLWSVLGWFERHPDRDRITRVDVEPEWRAEAARGGRRG